MESYEISSPPHDPHFSAPGSPPPSDDTHLSANDALLADDIRGKIIKQVEYYFSDENLPTDKYLMNLLKKDKNGFGWLFLKARSMTFWEISDEDVHTFYVPPCECKKYEEQDNLVPIAVIASFRKMKKLTQDIQLIVAALRESSQLVVSSDGKKVKRLHPLSLTEVKDSKICTVLIENLPEDHSTENIQRIFGAAGNIKKICIHDPYATEESTKDSRVEKLISGKLHAIVDYETVEAAERAVATLNNEQDWRNGMRVKLLHKQMGKYGQRRKGWKGSDMEKNSSVGAAHPAGDEENNSSERHDETPDEEDGEHLTKEKNGPRGRNRGRSRGQKYRCMNGQGHGTLSSSYGAEGSKPPPGPKMPDGTRGFTMGRGRPPVSSQN
ncbi:la-related protein 6A isoform X2 [Vitis riparia]|uniref:la-related protein 6A isoform X2 n=1 Tax=Vitis riparia TaxID=96939 RepID=UPI00155AFD55|nr:la-related protein 6A isoform X2 [Vitis riparia]